MNVVLTILVLAWVSTHFLFNSMHASLVKYDSIKIPERSLVPEEEGLIFMVMLRWFTCVMVLVCENFLVLHLASLIFFPYSQNTGLHNHGQNYLIIPFNFICISCYSVYFFSF